MSPILSIPLIEGLVWYADALNRTLVSGHL
jgi:hypothetical protein